jgi:hypothetical protein
MTSVKVLNIARVESPTDVVSKASICVLGMVAGLSGIWAFTCLASAIHSAGLVGLITGFITTVNF